MNLSESMTEPQCIHQVGRYPLNPKSRQSGLPTEQFFEVKEMGGKCGTLTTVQKDNLIAEAIPLCITEDGKSQTIKSQSYKNSIANFIGHEGTFGATGVAERIPEYGEANKSRPVEALYANHAGTGEGSLSLRLCSDNPAKQQVDLIAERVPEYGISDKSRPLTANYYKKSDSMGGVKADAFPDNPKQVFDFVAERIS